MYTVCSDIYVPIFRIFTVHKVKSMIATQHSYGSWSENIRERGLGEVDVDEFTRNT